MTDARWPGWPFQSSDPRVVPQPPFNIYHVDDCMYVAAVDAASALAHVRQECGEGCGDPEWCREVSRDLPVTMANVEDGEEATPDTMTTAGALAEEHLRYGGTLPHTVCFDQGM